MNRRTIRVLFVEDNPGDARFVKEMLRESTAPRFDMIHAPNLEEAFALLADSTLEAVLLDLNLPESQRLATLAEVRLKTALPIVVLTGMEDETLGYEAIRAGAQDYLVKGRIDSQTLVRSVRYAIERKSEEEALRESEEKYRMLFEGAAEGILVADIESRKFKYANPAICKILGYTEEELMRLGVEDIHPRESLDHVMAEFEAQARGDKTLASDLPCLRKDGGLIYVNVTTTPMVINDRPCNVGFFTDITERKRAEEALRQSEKRFRILFEQAADCIFLLEITPEGIPVIQDANSTAFRLLGYEREELIGRPVSFIDAAPDADKVVETRRQNVLSGTGKTFEAKHRCKDGTIRDFECSVSEIQLGSKTFAISVERDITERKYLEDHLRQAQKMEAVGQLASGVAHDFNNLLTIITGYCEIILGSIDEQNPLWKKITAIAQAGERAAQLTRQLLTFSRKQILKPKVISLNAVVNESKKLLSRLIGENIELRTALEQNLQPVLADPGQVEQVIMNLSVNARDAMPDGGDLSITTANVELSQEYAREHPEVKPGPYVLLAISDTGTGMSEEVKRHMFEPFFTTKEQGKGTGLGLPTVYGIVKQSNGHVNVYTELGHGTTFKVYFPVVLDIKESVQAEKQKVAKPVKGSETILIVEDESGVREFMVDVLRGAGYTVLMAESGEKAEKVCAGHHGPIHLLLTDMMLPRIGGREVARKLASTYPDAKVLFMSGYTDDVVFRSGGLAPGMAFLEKPFTPDALLRKVRQVLGSGV